MPLPHRTWRFGGLLGLMRVLSTRASHPASSDVEGLARLSGGVRVGSHSLRIGRGRDPEAQTRVERQAVQWAGSAGERQAARRRSGRGVEEQRRLAVVALLPTELSRRQPGRSAADRSPVPDGVQDRRLQGVARSRVLRSAGASRRCGCGRRTGRPRASLSGGAARDRCRPSGQDLGSGWWPSLTARRSSRCPSRHSRWHWTTGAPLEGGTRAHQRRGRDSNPRYGVTAQRFSRPPRSTTPAPLRGFTRLEDGPARRARTGSVARRRSDRSPACRSSPSRG